MIDLAPDGRLLLETHGNGQGAVWDVDPRVLGAAGLRPRQPHADPRGVGGVPPRPALPADLPVERPRSGTDRPGEARERGRRGEAAGA
jgi:hypothetical protein